MVRIELLEDSGLESIGPKLVEYFTAPILQTPDGVVQLEKESMVPTLDNLIGTHHTVLLVGEPGSGKSTFLRQLVHGYESQASQAYDTVIDIPLRAFEASGQQSLLSWFGTKVAPNSPQRVLWVLDGLDEVKEPEKIAGMLYEIGASRPDDHLIVAVRPVIAEEGILPEYTPVTVLPFSLEQAESCCRAYIEFAFTRDYFIPTILVTKDGSRVKLLDTMERIIREYAPRMRWLAKFLSNPSMIPYFIDTIAAGNINPPTDRRDFYRTFFEFVNQEKWINRDPDSYLAVFALPGITASASSFSSIDDWRETRLRIVKKRMRELEFYLYLAYRMIASNQSVISKEQLTGILREYFATKYAQDVAGIESLPQEFCQDRAEKFVEAADRGLPLMVRLGKDEYGFVHRSFFENIAAQAVLSTCDYDPAAVVSFLSEKHLLYSLHMREIIRIILEIYSQDEWLQMNSFLETILNENPDRQVENAALVASIITEDTAIIDIKPALVRIEKTLSAAIKSLQLTDTLQVQKQLKKIRLQSERLRRIVRQRGLERYIYGEEVSNGSRDAHHNHDSVGTEIAEMVERVQTLPKPELQKQFRTEICLSPTYNTSLGYPADIYVVRYYLFGREIGYAQLLVNHQEKTVTWNRFFPFRPLAMENEGIKGRVDVFSSLKRNKIGTLAHIDTIFRLTQMQPSTFDQYSICYADAMNTEEGMPEFLASLGIRCRYPATIPAYLADLKRYGEDIGFYFD
ncbi:NACHT domain-containing protein [Candidatus Gottesmanbacteria bacterium]|nr:NACHT domain-containing protein [Candidatus Gottesmanbacteria bacterium]